MKFNKVLKRIYHYFSFVKTLLKVIHDPGPEQVLKLDKILQKLALPRDIQIFIDELNAAPATARMLKSRYLAQNYTLADLEKYPSGSFGHAYWKYLHDNNLSVDYFDKIDPTNDWDYARLRILQTHDSWHVITGYGGDSSVAESSIVGFYIGHNERHMGVYSSSLNRFFVILTGCYFFHAAFFRPDRLRMFLHNVMEGWQRGQSAKYPLYDVHWESMWSRSLAELQSELGLLAQR